jgi:hypothetical protein
MSNMKRLGSRGELDALLIPLILAIVLLIGAASFGYWAYSQMQNYKNNTEQISAAAVQNANQQLTKQLQAQFNEQAKSPFKVYNGPGTYGSLHIVYPKTWSAYISENAANTGTPVDGYFYPDVVPYTGTDNNNASANFALRTQILGQTYSAVLQTFQSQVQQGQVTVRPFKLAKVPSVVGVEVTGQIQQNKTGTLIVLPVRNQTLEVWTEGDQFTKDFTGIILPNMSFSP